jgi:hypothetical protein
MTTLPPGKEPPGTHWIGVWVDPGASLDNIEKRKFCQLKNPMTPLGIEPVMFQLVEHGLNHFFFI